MNKKTEIENLIGRFQGTELSGLNFLIELALDLSWYWDHAADEIWERLDMALWEQTHNPWVVLKTVSFEKLKAFLADPAIQSKIAELQTKKSGPEEDSWFRKNHAQSPLSCIAYFCMEYMLSEGLPIYSGGLGNVAGDQLKAANDMGIPMVAVGLLYQLGYFRQVIGRDGSQKALYPYNDPGQLPIVPLRKKNGEWLRLKISFPGYSVWLRTWEVRIGKVKLFLLDSNDVANYPAHRGITSELYGGGPELRLQQEIILGIGGWRLLKELEIEPEICHLNEGHSALAILERARQLMEKTGQTFEAALAVTRSGNLFTTHTAVSAGFDRFSPHLIEQYLATYAKKELGISLQALLALGRINPSDSSEYFNMASLAIGGSGAVNGVSRLHAEVSRELFQPFFPRWPKEEVPVGYVTNGVHMRSWDSKAADDLWTHACGKNRWMGTTEKLDEHIRCVPDERLWEMRSSSRKLFIDFIRKRLPLDLAASGSSPEEVEKARHLFDPHALTIGFARRFATYKRPNLLLHDQDRLIRILSNPSKPVQIVLAGKAHPEDKDGQALIKEWVIFSRRPEVKSRVIFLSDYDMYLTGQMVQGVDVWLNTPRRPWEASGTSGMKVLVNGGLNLSELDGWWNEAYEPAVGWALGDGKEHGQDPNWDAAEAGQLYHLLENEVIPEFYSRDEKGIPASWAEKMRNSMSMLTPRFSTNRTLIEYTEQYYLPAAANFKRRLAANGEAGTRITNRKNALKEFWQDIKFGQVQIDQAENGYVFHVQVVLDGLLQDKIQVELYADGRNGATPERIKMLPDSSNENGKGSYSYRAQVESTRDKNEYTVRIIPKNEEVSIPLEDNLILWQR